MARAKRGIDDDAAGMPSGDSPEPGRGQGSAPRPSGRPSIFCVSHQVLEAGGDETERSLSMTRTSDASITEKMDPPGDRASIVLAWVSWANENKNKTQRMGSFWT